MDESVRLFSRFFWRTQVQWAPLLSFRQTAKLGLAAALPELERRAEDASQHLLSPEMADIFLDREGFVKSGGVKTFRESHLDASARDFSLTVDAASIVFAHSILEDLAMDALGVIRCHAPADLTGAIKDKTAKISDIERLGYDAVIGSKLDEWITQISREPLMKKLAAIYTLCRPDKGFQPLQNGYTYDAERIRRFDELRHRVVHEVHVPSLEPGVLDAEVEYLRDTSLSFVSLIFHRYRIKIDPEVLPGGSRQV